MRRLRKTMIRISSRLPRSGGLSALSVISRAVLQQGGERERDLAVDDGRYRCRIGFDLHAENAGLPGQHRLVELGGRDGGHATSRVRLDELDRMIQEHGGGHDGIAGEM